MEIIGLAGAKRAGKNTVASFIADILSTTDYTVYELSFAEKLKISAARSLGVKYVDKDPNAEAKQAVEWADVFKEHGKLTYELKIPGEGGVVEHREISGREYLQWYGTESHREIFGTDFWVETLFDEIEHLWNTNSICVITDVRFPNEASAVANYGGSVVRVRRSEVESGKDTHASEKPLPSELVHYELWNNSDLTELSIKTEIILESLVLG